VMNLLTNSPDEIVRLITETHEQLSQQRDLSPNNDLVNFQLTRLVNFVTQTHHEQDAKNALQVLADRGLVKKMRVLCQEAEFQLEKYYSSAILELSRN
jgi:hypothetical protein